MTALCRHGAEREMEQNATGARICLPRRSTAKAGDPQQRHLQPMRQHFGRPNIVTLPNPHTDASSKHCHILSRPRPRNTNSATMNRRSAGFSPLQPHLQPACQSSNNPIIITASRCRPAAPSRHPCDNAKPHCHNAPNTKNNTRNQGNNPPLAIGNFVTRNPLQINQQNTKKQKNKKNNIFF